MSETTKLDSSWVGASVSWGTMREEDLIPKLESVLDSVGYGYERPAAVKKLIEDATVAGGDLTDDEWAEVSWYLNEDLWDAMNEIAPEGTTFGSHEGDGADYGFWSYEDEDDCEDDCENDIRACPACSEDNTRSIEWDNAHKVATCTNCGHQFYAEDPPAFVVDRGEAKDYEHIRVWQSGDFRLDLYDTGRRDGGAFGKCYLAYTFRHKGEVIFQGEDFSPGASMSIDGDAAVAGLLVFLSLRPGDTDKEYFERYTEKQLTFAQAHGEELSMLADELENGREDD